MAKVAVVMAVYNGERWLAEAIESVLVQTFADFELLIHDDGSTDNSLKILRDYAATDARITVTTGTNEGLAATLNRLIGTARAPFLARMDADDICLPDRFAKQVAYLDENPDCAVLGACETTIDAAGRRIAKIRVPLTHEEIDANNLRGVTSITHPTVMMRRDTVLRCGYDPTYPTSQDLDLWLRMAEIGRLANLPDIVLEFRIHGGSISGSKQDLQRQMCRRACEAAWARRGLTGMTFDYSDWRMADTPESRRAFHLRYGWQAWNHGYRDTWRHYALRSVADAPLSVEAWKLLIAGAIKRPRRKGA
ncbi:MAG: glycosyltransferase [Spiribacter salinus]|uniref:Glycosyltransferase n=1 Tax=Spiribacter salinus TaxID=1335746 RepID=A0A540VP47_9GAMM|nr:MAG: glycosyltransferase [Spiribacter salinus]